MNELFTKKFFKFLSGFLLIIAGTLLIVVGIQSTQDASQQAQVGPTSSIATTTEQ